MAATAALETAVADKSFVWAIGNKRENVVVMVVGKEEGKSQFAGAHYASAAITTITTTGSNITDSKVHAHILRCAMYCTTMYGEYGVVHFNKNPELKWRPRKERNSLAASAAVAA